MKTFLIIVAALITLVAVIALVCYTAGARMPREHRSVITTTLGANRAAVWAAITDYAAMPTWWPAVKAIRTEKLPDGTELTWNRDAHGHEIPFRTKTARNGELLVREIASHEGPFGGTWTFELADAAGGGTQLKLTEDGFINPPIFRAVANWFMGLDATQKDFVSHLEKRLAPNSADRKTS